MKKPLSSADAEKAIVEKQAAETDKYSEEEKRKIQKEIQKQFNMFKKRFKPKSKSELVAIIWEQGMEFKKLQNIAAELYEENIALKESKDAKENSETTSAENN